MAAAARRPASSQADRHCRGPAARRSASPLARDARVGPHDRLRLVRGLVPAERRVDDDLPQLGKRGEPAGEAPCWSACRRSGSPARAPAPRAAGGRSRRTARRRAGGHGLRGEAARSARRGSGSPPARPARPPARRASRRAGGRRRSGPGARPTPARRARRPAPRRRAAGPRRPRSVAARRGPRGRAARSPSRPRGAARVPAGRARRTFRWTGPGRGSPRAAA